MPNWTVVTSIHWIEFSPINKKKTEGLTYNGSKSEKQKNNNRSIDPWSDPVYTITFQYSDTRKQNKIEKTKTQRQKPTILREPNSDQKKRDPKTKSHNMRYKHVNQVKEKK